MPLPDDWLPEILKNGICSENKTLPCCKNAWTKFEENRPELRSYTYDGWEPIHFSSCSGDGYFESLQCEQYKVYADDIGIGLSTKIVVT